MKRIVVYIIVFLTWFLILPTGLTAQKPTIDLISSHHQHKHPEAIIDTGYSENPPLREAVMTQKPPVQDQELVKKSGKKKRRQIGPSIDSLFNKEESRDSIREKPPAKTSYFDRRFNPIKVLIYIIALK